MELRALIGLAEGSLLWQWQPDLRYYLVDEVAYGEADLARRQGLVPLLFRLENAPDPDRIVTVVNALMAVFEGNPGLVALRCVGLMPRVIDSHETVHPSGKTFGRRRQVETGRHDGACTIETRSPPPGIVALMEPQMHTDAHK